VPADTPVTTPALLTTAIASSDPANVPPPVAVSVIDAFTHTFVGPVGVAGSGFTVTTFVVVAVPQLLVIV
jgi:hypothetical protein